MYIHEAYKTKPVRSTVMGEGTATVETITTGIQTGVCIQVGISHHQIIALADSYITVP
jgi:hypothetical protein